MLFGLAITGGVIVWIADHCGVRAGLATFLALIALVLLEGAYQVWNDSERTLETSRAASDTRSRATPLVVTYDPDDPACHLAVDIADDEGGASHHFEVHSVKLRNSGPLTVDDVVCVLTDVTPTPFSWSGIWGQTMRLSDDAGDCARSHAGISLHPGATATYGIVSSGKAPSSEGYDVWMMFGPAQVNGLAAWNCFMFGDYVMTFEARGRNCPPRSFTVAVSMPSDRSRLTFELIA